MNTTEVKAPGSPHDSEHTFDNSIEKGHGVGISTFDEQDEPFIVDAAMEKRLNWKCDLKILPPLILLFMITFVDRTNIANAKIQHMTEDLKMKGTDYNMALWILNIPYIVLAVPSNMLMKKGFVKPSVYLSASMFCWGKSSPQLRVTSIS